MGYTTKKSLLEHIREGNEVSWYEFEQTYRPLIFLRGSDYRLSMPEKEELCQLVLLDVFKGQRHFQYDPAKGRFRDYLRKIISNNAVDIIRKRNNASMISPEFSDGHDSSLEAAWEEEWISHILQQALNLLREDTDPAAYQAFHLYVIEEKSPKEVAQFLGISINNVYIYKSRMLNRLRKIIKQIQEGEA